MQLKQRSHLEVAMNVWNLSQNLSVHQLVAHDYSWTAIILRKC